MAGTWDTSISRASYDAQSGPDSEALHKIFDFGFWHTLGVQGGNLTVFLWVERHATAQQLGGGFEVGEDRGGRGGRDGYLQPSAAAWQDG
ncbi:MAG: hypothetical protein LWW81_11560, partial [Rhodocyclales bacterium]|nr:hypothetical protein [Rhodocyclales bacterium]